MTFFPRSPGALARVWGNRSRNDWIPHHATTVADALQRSVVRLPTRLPWLDFMLGGGFVRGSVVMFHGEPGSGKSTALAQAASAIRGAFYVSSEEPVNAVAARVIRLGGNRSMELIEESDIGVILDTIGRAPLVVIDSLQQLAGNSVTNMQLIVRYARQNNICIAIVVHEIKSGAHAGPRMLEHLIDTTIQISRGPPRSITTEKNRFGPAGISLLLNMTDKGLSA